MQWRETLNNTWPVRSCLWLTIWLTGWPGCAAAIEPLSKNVTVVSLQKQADASAAKGLGTLAIWDDGLAEMSYYRAVDRIYGKARNYTRTILVNRQWINGETGVKAVTTAERTAPVLKLNIVEQIPTENYNYRYQTTLFLNRYSLSPQKAVYSSQDWCGTTFKHLRWRSQALAVAQSFSYFGDEGDKVWTFDREAVPYESLLLIARDVVATRKPRELKVLTSLRSNHAVELVIEPAKLVPMDTLERVSVAAGEFLALRVNVQWDGPKTGFLVEASPPYRLLRYIMGSAHGELRHTEHRAYWNRDWPSDFYPLEKAP